MSGEPRPIPTLEESDVERSIVAGGLRLSFRNAGGDRWSHALIADLGGDRVELASSLEAEGDDLARVVSPTYQDLHFQAENSAILAFLVGQSGFHHFSAVFRLEIAGGSTTIFVDAADRCRSPVDAFAATYLVRGASGDLIAADPSSASWGLGGSTLRVEPIGDARLALAEGGRRGTQLQVDTPIRPDSSTQRCRYRWSWTPGTPPERTR